MSKVEYKRDPGRAMMSAFAHCPSEKSHPEKMAWIAEYFLGEVIGTQIAANKATEEGELPALPTNSFHIGYSANEMREYARQAIAADRASRQVANKAEVDLSNLKRFDVNYDQGGVFFSASEFGKYYKVSDVEVLLATPPATTGASTAPRPTDDELWDSTLRDRDAYHDWADKLADAIAKHFGVDIGEHSNQNLPWAEALEAIENAEPVGASTVLTDERIDNLWHEACLKHLDLDDSAIPDFARAIERETLIAALIANDKKIDPVSAQAGQVAVPELMRQAVATVVSRAGDNLRIGWLRPERCDVGTLLYCAAPSPAKESK